MKEVENFIWHDLADDYIEMVKARKDDAVKYTMYNVLLGSLKMMAPFMPAHNRGRLPGALRQDRREQEHTLSSWREPMFIDEEALAGDRAAEILADIRAWKSGRKLPLNTEIACTSSSSATRPPSSRRRRPT